MIAPVIAAGSMDQFMSDSWERDVLALTAVWTVLHFLAPALLNIALAQTGSPGLAKRISERVASLPAERHRTLRRYVRAQLYYLMAGPLGIVLLSRVRSFPDLLHMQTELHGHAFTLAAAHWLVSLVEDASTPSSFTVRLSKKNREKGEKGINFYFLYLLHHAIAIAAFSVCLATRALPALGACGMLFELPVAFVNIRDLLRDFDLELRWFRPLGGWELVDFCWTGTAVSVIIGRFIPVGLYWYGIWRWNDPGGVGSLSVPNRVAYVLLGFFFTTLSVCWAALMQHVAKLDQEDLSAESRARERALTGDVDDDISVTSVDGAGGVSDGEIEAPLVKGKCPFTGMMASDAKKVELNVLDAGKGGHRKGADTAPPQASDHSDNSKEARAARLLEEHKAAFDEVSIGARRKLDTMTVEEYQLADKKLFKPGVENKLLIVVDGIVYDVTAFAAKHPGGRYPFENHSGNLDSSDSFHRIGHSETARILMREFAVATLPAGMGVTKQETMEERKTRIEAALRQERIMKTGRPYMAMASAGWDELVPGTSEYLTFQYFLWVPIAILSLNPVATFLFHSPERKGELAAPVVIPATTWDGSAPVWFDEILSTFAPLFSGLNFELWTMVIWMVALVALTVERDMLYTNSAAGERPPLRGALCTMFCSPTCHAHALVALAAHFVLWALISQTQRAATLLLATELLAPVGVVVVRSALVTTRGICAAALALMSLACLLPYAAAHERPATSTEGGLLAGGDTHPGAPWGMREALVGTPQGRDAVLAVCATVLSMMQHALASRYVRVMPNAKPLHVILAAVYMTLATALLAPVRPAFGALIWSLLPGSVPQFFWMAAFVNVLTIRFGVFEPLHDGVFPWTASVELQTIVVAPVAFFTAVARGELSMGQWMLTALLVLAHWSRLDIETREKLRNGLRADEARFAWHGVALDAESQFRFILSALIFTLARMFVSFANWIIPRPAYFYAHPTPTAHYGDGVEMGVAYFVYPGGGSRHSLEKEGIKPLPQQKPTTFVCNVGHMLRDRDGQDWMKLGYSTIKMSESLKTEEAQRKGFCGQYLAEFAGDHGSVRQLNLTAWKDDHAAHDWYVNNEEHREVVAQYRNGLLASFSSVLSRLHNADGKPAKFHVRCLYCRAVLTKYPEQRFCKDCGWEAQYMPFF